MTTATKAKAAKPKKIDPKADPVELLDKLGACSEAIVWAGKFNTIKAAWQKCKNVEWMIWALNAADLWNDKQARLLACWCVRNTPLPDGRKVWDLLTDDRSRKAVEVSERFANGEATQEELDAARAAARDAAWAAARDAARAAARDAARDAAWAAARDAQCKQLHKMVDPFK